MSGRVKSFLEKITSQSTVLISIKLVQQIGHLHDGVILLLRPEPFSFFLSYLNFVIPVRFE